MSESAGTISAAVRRRLILGKQGLWPGRRWSGKTGTAEALREVEAVQIDPVSVVAQSHDIVLWGRVNGFWPEAWFAPDAAFAAALSKGLEQFGRFLGAERVGSEALDPSLLPGR
jgi:uncharacterized protein YcaQ